MGKKKRNKSAQAGGLGAVATEIRQVATPRTQGFSVAQTSKPNFFPGAVFEWLAITASALLAFWFLTARVAGVNVSVLIDEYSYVLDSHYRALTEAYYPNYLFQLVYSTTKQCGPEFYSCARSLNAVFVIAGAVFLYLLAKYVSGKKWLGAVAAIAGILGSYGTYTAYFMPEAIFNFPMLVFFWALVRFGKTENLMGWIGLGVILGIASLAKPHAFFVIPALLIFVFFWTRATKERFLLQAILRISSFLAGAVGAKFLLGYSIAGTKALNIFGSYGDVAGAGNAAITAASGNSGLNLIGTAWGQTLMIVMILGFALPVAIAGLISGLRRDAIVFEANRVRFVVGLSLLNMMAVSALFEAWLSLFTWMHTRYYSYLIPLALIVLIEGYSRSSTRTKPLIQRLVVAVFVLLASVALVTAAIPYGANWIDAPDFRFHIDNIVVSSILIIVSIGLAIWWLWDNKTPLLIGIIVSLLASTLSGGHISSFLVANFGQDSVHDQLGRVLRNYIPQEELDKTVLVGDNNTTMERALFTSLSGGAKAILAPKEGFDVANVPPGTLWLVKVGEPIILGLDQPDISGSGYSLYSLSAQNKLEPRFTELRAFSGQCGDQELAGWSCNGTTEVVFEEELGANATIDLIIEVSEQASDSEIDFIFGDSVLTGSLPAGTSSLTLNFANSGSAGSLTVKSRSQQLVDSSEAAATFRIVSLVGVSRR
jgi:phosphoglycerol transferase